MCLFAVSFIVLYVTYRNAFNTNASVVGEIKITYLRNKLTYQSVSEMNAKFVTVTVCTVHPYSCSRLSGVCDVWRNLRWTRSSLRHEPAVSRSYVYTRNQYVWRELRKRDGDRSEQWTAEGGGIRQQRWDDCQRDGFVWQWLKCNATQGNAVPPPTIYDWKRSPSQIVIMRGKGTRPLSGAQTWM